MFHLPETEQPADNVAAQPLKTIMNAILAQLIAASIDENKIPGLDYFSMKERADGVFHIILDSGEVIKVTVEVEQTTKD